MFPLCDLRGRVLGFGARALGEDQQPKYLNSSDNAVYHKGRHLFGADIARAAAAKAGSVIVAEGYTDVIAMHQAGLRNTVGLMGTALTEEQVGELARLAPRVLLALDADGAGQEAMLRAARVAAGRKLELRVVPLPVGTDPADLVRPRAREAMQRLVDQSVPFVRFRVERELATGDLTSAEGKDAVIAALRRCSRRSRRARCARSWSRWVADRTDLAPALVGSWLAQGGRRGGAPTGAAAVRPAAIAAVVVAVGGVPARFRRRTRVVGEPGPRDERGAGGCSAAPAPFASLDAAARAERAFLAQCLAVPSAGKPVLAELDLETAFTSE